MLLEENPFSGNNSVRFTSPEFVKYEALEKIVQKNGGANLQEFVIKTAKDVLELIVNSESLVIEKGSLKQEVVLPLIEREYVNPLRVKPCFNESDNMGETYQYEIDLSQVEFNALLSLKSLYQKAESGKAFNEAPFNADEVGIQEIFEIGLNYLGELVKMSLEGYNSIRILDAKRKATTKALSVEGILRNIRTGRERELQQEYDLKKAVAEMEIALKDGLEKLKVHTGTSYDMKVMLDKRRMKEDIGWQIKKLPTYYGKCPDMLSPEERIRKEKDI